MGDRPHKRTQWEKSFNGETLGFIILKFQVQSISGFLPEMDCSDVVYTEGGKIRVFKSHENANGLMESKSIFGKIIPLPIWE